MNLRNQTAYFPDNSPLAIKPVASQHICPLHSHDFHEMVCVSSGSGLHVIDGVAWPVSRGSLFIVTPGENHYF